MIVLDLYLVSLLAPANQVWGQKFFSVICYLISLMVYRFNGWLVVVGFVMHFWIFWCLDDGSSSSLV